MDDGRVGTDLEVLAMDGGGPMAGESSSELSGMSSCEIAGEEAVAQEEERARPPRVGQP
jgi:hypothetical protein